jgi:hypothetical protein
LNDSFDVAKKSKAPYVNWLTLEDGFDYEDLKEYFHYEISSLANLLAIKQIFNSSNKQIGTNGVKGK